MDYTPDPETGLLTEEYVDVYGIPFSVVPFKGRAIDKPAPEDRPKNHVFAMPKRVALNPLFEIRFPVVDGYAFALKRNLLACDVSKMEKLVLEPNREPVATFLAPTVGYQEGHPSQNATFGFSPQDRNSYYRDTHLQTIKFQVAKLIAGDFAAQRGTTDAAARRVGGLQSRHQLFPQIYRFVDEYVRTRVDFHGCDPCELGLERYAAIDHRATAGGNTSGCGPRRATADAAAQPIQTNRHIGGSGFQNDTTLQSDGTQSHQSGGPGYRHMGGEYGISFGTTGPRWKDHLLRSQ